MDKDLRKIQAPIFEISLHLRIPAESDSSENYQENFQESAECSEKSVMCEEDEISKSEVSCAIKHSSSVLPVTKPQKTNDNLEEILSGKTDETVKSERGALAYVA